MEKNKKDIVDISVVVPVYNEEAVLFELYERLTTTLKKISDNYEIIFINDGSSDNSLQKINSLVEDDEKVFYVNFSRNFGHQIAVTAGVDLCKGKAVIIIDGDLQDPPELILDMYKKHKEGYNVVYAIRAEREGESFFKKSTAALFYKLLRKITMIDIPLDTGDFRLIDDRIVRYLKQMPEQNKFIRGQVSWLGFKQIGIQYKRNGRKHGETGYSLKKMVQLATDAITSFSDIPLKTVTRAGFLISLVSFLVIIYALYAHFILDKTIAGWTSLIFSTMFIGGVQLFSVGIIGTYISRINKNVMNRPLYIISDTNIGKDLL